MTAGRSHHPVSADKVETIRLTWLQDPMPDGVAERFAKGDIATLLAAYYEMRDDRDSLLRELSEESDSVVSDDLRSGD